MRNKLLLLLFLITSITFSQTRIYVKANARPGGNGQSWASPYRSLNTALDNASDGDEIWIAKGYYIDSGLDITDVFTIAKNGLKIYGGFAGTETNLSDRNLSLIHTRNKTTISADVDFDDDADFSYITDNKLKVFKIEGSNTLLDGLVMSGAHGRGSTGYSNNGCAIYVSRTVTGLTINRCVIEDNYAVGISAIMYPVDVNSTLKITNSIIRHNKTEGGTVYVYNSNDVNARNTVNFSFVNNLVVDNEATKYGGSTMWIRTTWWLKRIYAKVINNTIVNNKDTGTGTQTTIVASRNRYTDPNFPTGEASVDCVNNIFWDNLGSSGGQNEAIGTGIIAGSFKGTESFRACIGKHRGNSTNNINPNLTNDYKLQATSTAAIDLGLNAGIQSYTEDLAGNARVCGTGSTPRVDKGAYEYQASCVYQVTQITVNGSNITTDNGNSQMNATILPTNATNGAIKWSVNDPNIAIIDETSGLLSAVGNGTVTVTATAQDGSNVTGTKQITITNQTQPVRLYVNFNASGDNNGSSWTDAYENLEDALATVGSTVNKEIWVAKGTYKDLRTARTDVFKITENDVKIYGGFVGTEARIEDRVDIHTTNRTILSADIANNDTSTFGNVSDNKVHVLSIVGDNATLDGLTLSGGRADINGNDNNNASGIFLKRSTTAFTMNNCIVEKNSGQGLSVIMLVAEASATLNITNSIIRDNYMQGATVYVYTNTNNISVDVNLTNNLFVKNKASVYPGNAGWFRAAKPGASVNLNVINNTIVDNIDYDNTSNGAIFTPIAVAKENASATAVATIANTIFWNNKKNNSNIRKAISKGLSSSSAIAANVTVKNSIGDFSNINTSNLTNVSNSTPDLDSDYKPQTSSADVIDKGENTSVPSNVTKDLAGNNRKFNTTVDIGAYEYINTSIVPVTGITVTGSPITTNGGTTTMTATVAPTNATNSSVTWSVNDASIATINATTGELTAVSNGNVIVTATANDGSNVSGTATIAISGQTIPVTGITVTGSAITTNDGTTTMTATVAPTNATNSSVTWSVNDASIATINATTGELTAVSNGNVIVTATANDGSNVTGTATIAISGQVACTTFVNIPDNKLKTALVSDTAINLDGDNEICLTEAQNFTGTLFLGSLQISDATGLEAFVNATKLQIQGNDLTRLDLSRNTKLEEISCNYNTNLTTLIIGNNTALKNLNAGAIKITSIDLSGTTNLESLSVGGNSSLTGINLSQVPSLKTIDISGCTAISGTGAVREIDFSQNTALVKIGVNNCGLTKLDVSANSNLKHLFCKGNSDLTSLIVSNSNNVNMGSIFELALDASNNSSLTCVQIDANFTPGSSWVIPQTASYNTNCSLSSTILVTSISVGGSDITTNGGTSQMAATVLPTNATNSSVTWSVDDASIATINSSGLLTAVSNGTVTVTATSQDGSNITGTKQITVSGQTVSVTNISVGGSDITTNGGTSQMAATVLPTNATNSSVTWSVNDASIATINSSGLLTAVSNGTVTVTATSQDGSNITGTKQITVSGQTVSVTNISVSGSNITTNGGTSQMAATVLPSNATNSSVTWSVDDVSIATINSSGLLTAVSNGTVTVTATSQDGSNITGTKQITVSGQSTCTRIVNIPNANFKAVLLANTAINTDGDNEICESEAANYTGAIDLTNENVTNLTGLEKFVNITILNCFNNRNLTSIDVSQNTKLIALNLNACNLSTIDVSDNTVLKSLYCAFNTNLTTINIKNGNNARMGTMTSIPGTAQTFALNAQYCNSLTCVQKDTGFTPNSSWNGVAANLYKDNCNQPSTVLVTSISVSGSNITTNGGTSQMAATVLPSNATNSSVTWSVDDSSIATINSNGLLTAVSNGTVTVTATSQDGSNITGTKQITVSGQTVSVTNVSVSGSDITTNGGTSQMAATVLPTNATNSSVTWSVDDANIATINSSGLLTAVSNGTVTVTATSQDGSNITGTKQITVSGQTVSVTNVSVSGSDITTSGGTSQMAATVLPANATNSSVTWSVDNANIATINSSGLLTAVSNGTVTVTATSQDGSNITGTKQITVSGQTVSVTNISVSGSNITTNVGTSQMSATVLPANATNSSVTWSVDDANIATINSSGLLTAVSNGTVTVTATSQDGSNITGTKQITVSGQGVSVTSISVSGSDITTSGGTSQMTATVLPSNATNSSITWSVDDSSIATINSSGLLTAVSNGTVTVTATSQDGSNITGTKQISVSGQAGIVTPPALEVVTSPKGFSPNNDGINDVWVIDNITSYPKNVVKVFTRSGRKVFEKNNYQNNWSGTKKDSQEQLSAGSYYYIIEFNESGKKPVQGWLYINY